MASVVDLWRAVDPDARLLSGSDAGLGRPVRAVQRTRSAAPHLPEVMEGALLVVDGSVVGPMDRLFAALAEAGLAPVAVILTGPGPEDAASRDVPVLHSQLPASSLTAAATGYLADEGAWLARLGMELRLLCAEAALSEPDPATPAGLIAARIRRGVAVAAEGELRSLHPRPAGRALAARFAALHARLLAAGGQHGQASRRTREGIWVMDRRIRPGASVWLFDDLPFAALDEVAADAAAVTLRALLRRPASPPGAPAAGGARQPSPGAPRRSAAAPDPVAATLLAVARHNGRVAPAARELGVHRNTVLYRLQRAAAERGIDPRRPQDALRILAEADRS